MNNHVPIPDRAFEFAVRITKICSYLDKQTGTPRLLAAQLFRSGTLIGANIEESQSAESDKDFISKQSIALNSLSVSAIALFALVQRGVNKLPIPNQRNSYAVFILIFE